MVEIPFMHHKPLTISTVCTSLMGLDPAWTVVCFLSEDISGYTRGRDPYLPYKAQCWVLFCSLFIPILLVAVLFSNWFLCPWPSTHLILYFPPSDTQVSAQILACLAGISSWIAAHQLKLNSSKPELLYIPRDISPCQDLVISLDNSQISPSVTAHNLVETMENHLSFLPRIASLIESCQFFIHWEDHCWSYCEALFSCRQAR